MQELADYPVGHARDDLFSILVETVKLTQGATELGVGDRSGVLAQLRDQIGCFPAVEPVHHHVGLPSYDLLDHRHGREAPAEILVERRLEFVDVVKHYARERPDRQIDVPRNGYVDDYQRNSLPLLKNGFHVLRIDHGVRGPRGGDHRVSVRQSRSQLPPWPSLTTVAKSEGLGARESAIDAGHPTGAMLVQRLNRELSSLSCPHHQDAPG